MISIFKKIIAFNIVIILTVSALYAQNKAGINYQAVARDNAGVVMADASMTVILSILDEAGTALWEETHGVTTSPLGLFSLVLGTDATKVTHNTVESLQAIDWNVESYTLTVQVDAGSGLVELGSNIIQAVPMALYGEDADADPDNEIQDLALNSGKLTITRNTSASDIDLSGFVDSKMAWQKNASNVLLPTGSVGIGVSVPEGVMDIQGSLPGDDPIFQVKNDQGIPVFAVYNEGVRVYIPDDLPLEKGVKGGFAVGGYNAQKALLSDEYFLQVMPGATKLNFFADESDKSGENDAKGIKGGFAVGGYNQNKTVESSFVYMDPYAVPFNTDVGGGTVIVFPLFNVLAAKGNCYIGTMAGQNHAGRFNTAIGYQSGYSLDAGYLFPDFTPAAAAYNTNLGAFAGYANKYGDKNVYLGYQAGYNNVGSGNVFIGYQAGARAADISNILYIDNEDTVDPLIGGDFDNDYIKLNGYVGINQDPLDAFALRTIGNIQVIGTGYATGGFQDVSDARLKEDVRIIESALNIIDQIRGVRFKFKVNENPEYKLSSDPQVGVIAQEVEAVLPELVSEQVDGTKTVDYGKLSAVLIEAVKEQQEMMEDMQQTIEELSKKVEELEER